MDKINYTTGAGADIPNNYNATRKMTDEQLKQLFEPGDTPTNEDHIAIIDSKVNIDDVYGKEKVDTLFSDHVNNMHKDLVKIDDINISTSTVYSSNKIENRIANHRHDASDIDNLPQPGGSSSSKDITYDNATSKLKSTNVQGAIDELVVNDATITGKVDKNTTDISENKTSILEVRDIANSAKQRGDEVKQILVEKLISEGSEVSTSESFEELINKIEIEKHSLPLWMNKGDYFINAAPRPIKRGKSIASAIGSKIYVIGGNKSTDNYSTCAVDIYDTVENSWVTNEISGYGINSAQSACSIGEFIYIPGKYCLQYDPLTNTYSEKAKMPKTSEYGSACAIDGFIYVIGGQYEYTSSGYTKYEILNKNQRYDPVTDTWTELSTMPTERSSLTSSVVDGKIYCIGGKNDSNSTIRANECYDPITNTWTTKKSFGAYSVITKTSEVHGENIYVFGGSTATALNTLAYNTVTDSWTNKSSIDKYRNYLCSASANGKIYVIGGDFSDTTGDVSVINNIYIP